MTLFCKYIKLNNGENIVCMTDDPCNNLSNSRSIVIMDPMTVTAIRIPRPSGISETYIMTPWMPITDEKILEINTRSIISAADARTSFREQYENYVEYLSKPELISEHVELTEQEQQDIEEISNSLLEDDEENDNGFWNSGSRTLH